MTTAIVIIISFLLGWIASWQANRWALQRQAGRTRKRQVPNIGMPLFERNREYSPFGLKWIPTGEVVPSSDWNYFRHQQMMAQAEAEQLEQHQREQVLFSSSYSMETLDEVTELRRKGGLI